MANPTTYFGWVMPTATDLVTDLPADFNVFGQGVDTSMQGLLGGTTGQVLSKTSATNMAFTWVTPTDQTPLTTKGDLFTFTTVDARLGIGTNNQVLTADSAQATGMKWATPSPGSRGLNEIIPSSVSVGSGTATIGTNGKITFTTVGTNLSINGVFSSTYTNYKMVMDFDDSANNGAYMRLRVSGADNTTASSYVSQTLQAQATTVSTARSTQSYWNEPFFSNSNATNAVELNFYRPFLADTTAYTSLAISSASGAHLFVACGTQNQNTSFDGFSIIPGSTNTLSGGLTIYGWNE